MTRRAASSDGWTWDLTQRECVKRRWHVERVDWRDRFGHDHDLFGVFDALAFDPAEPGQTYAIQFTSASNRAARRKKVDALGILPLLQRSGWVALIWAWRITRGKPVLGEDVL